MFDYKKRKIITKELESNEWGIVGGVSVKLTAFFILLLQIVVFGRENYTLQHLYHLNIF